MDSADLAGEFSDWIDLTSQDITIVPTKPGVYAIRMKNGVRFGRLRGESDIVYMGRTAKGLRGRLRQYFNPDPTQLTNRRVNQLMRRYDLEVAWKEDQNPSITEHNLLLQYVTDHDELPPLNRQYPKTVVVELGEELHVGDGAESRVDRL